MHSRRTIEQSTANLPPVRLLCVLLPPTHRHLFNSTENKAELDRYRAECSAAYAQVFEQLPEEERDNRDARRELLQPLVDQYMENSTLVVDERKTKGGAKALMKKTLDPFLNEASKAGRSWLVLIHRRLEHGGLQAHRQSRLGIRSGPQQRRRQYVGRYSAIRGNEK